MDIRHLRYFVTVAETLSFVKAARELNMSQPPLSKRIADLEEELGVRLFERTSKQVELTEAGKKLLPHAWETVKTFDVTRRVARNLLPEQVVRVRIGLPPETSRELLSGLIGKLADDRIDVQLLEASTAEQQHLLASNEIDIGVLRYPFDERGLHLSPPMAQSLGLVMDARHPLAKKDAVTLSEIGAYPLVIFPRRLSPGLYDELLQSCQLAGYTPSRIIHCTLMGRAMLKTEMAVAFAAERPGSKGQDQTRKEFVWKPIEESLIHWWTSVACRLELNVGPVRRAFDKLVIALQQHENWVKLERPASALHYTGETERDFSRDFIQI